ncbi:recombinase family protein [Roseiconus lacunae]|uniref:Recombinase family protein n=1 Tax=Roseiconus lacunae TaxID=2605694 RepID=A0ABT7PF40_9BACT|nr:recombinase family protein [Roseiconus lacunae]MDM4015110.1 recombinase family protein [Roseiconus lacunae]
MQSTITEVGQANQGVARQALDHWAEAAEKSGIDLDGFDPTASDEALIDWAVANGLTIATIYSRYSTEMQQSTADQIRECVIWAAKNGIFVPPCFISVDEGVKGSKSRRVGLNRTRQIFSSRKARVLLVYKASRLFRSAGKGYQLIQEEVVEEGLRAVSVSQGIDTDDKKSWKLQLQIHGLMDEMLLDVIADHVRDGQKGLFLDQFTTGALSVGFVPEEVPNARKTNRGLPRTRPTVDPIAAALIQEHARLILCGMSLREGVRRWNEAGGPCDPRSSSGRMTYPAYRRLFSNPKLIGRWEFGRKRNEFSSKRDYVKQVEQSESEVLVKQIDELRILDDQTYFALQRKFEERKTGPRGPRNEKVSKLWDLATECFRCSHCGTSEKPVRFHMAGANGRGMRCSQGETCSCSTCLHRKTAVIEVCCELAKLLDEQAQTIAEEVSRIPDDRDQFVEETRKSIACAEIELKSMENRVDALFELYADSSGDGRTEARSHLRAAQMRRDAVVAELRELRNSLDTNRELTYDEALSQLSEMALLLRRAARDELEGDEIFQALSLFRSITGGSIEVEVQTRRGRKQKVAEGIIRPQIRVALADWSDTLIPGTDPNEELRIWLRRPPRVDFLAERVHQLIDEQGLSHRQTAKQLQQEGHKINSGNVWYSYRRWYEMTGQPIPVLPYNNGNKRQSA